MRVVFLTHNFPRYPGDAAGSFLLRLAIALRDVDVDVRVVAPAAADVAPNDVIEGIAVSRFRYAPRARETIAYTGNMAADVRGSWGARGALLGMIAAGARAASRECVRHRAELLHAHWWFPAGLSATLPLAPRTLPLVVTSHGSDVRLGGATAMGRTLFARVARRADAYTFVSRWLREQVATFHDLPGAEVAPMPVATDVFTPPPAGGPRAGLLFVGRLNAQKGPAELLRASARQRTPTELTFVGDGPDAASLRALAESLGVAARVRWSSAVPQTQLAALYRAAAALVVPSTDEGLGLVAVEAQLCETPVVAFASGGLTDVVADGTTGLLVPPGDTDALAAALDRVGADHDLARALGTGGRAAAMGRFAPAAVASRYRAVYESALRARGGKRA